MSVAQTKSGNWYVQYRVPGIRSPQKEYFGKGEASKRQAEERKMEIQTGNVYTVRAVSFRKNIYFDELTQCYLDVMRSCNKNQNWINTIISLSNNHFLPLLTHVPVDKLEFQDILNVAQRFTDKSPATLNRYMDTLHAILNFGMKHDLTTVDPMKHWIKSKEAKRDFILNIEDLKRIYESSPDHLKWIIEVQWELGTRPGRSELFALRWSDVNFNESCIRIRGTKNKASNRVIPLTDNFKQRLWDKKQISTCEFIIEYNGRQITHCRRSFNEVCRKVGISYSVRLYDIRHLVASTMLANGGDLKAVSKILGHSTTRMTADTYYHELKGEKLRALERKPNLT